MERNIDDGRVEREREIHNQRFANEGSRSSQSKYYWAVEDGADDYIQTCQTLAKGKDILEYGCGVAKNFQTLAPMANRIHAIDISEVAIERLKAENQFDNVELRVMDAMNMTFPDNSFDFVFGSGIIHHLETKVAAQEIARVLRPGGRAVFWEPFGMNPLINAYRRFTPDARTPDEHPLLPTDLADIGRLFRTVDTHYYGFATLASVPLQNRRIGQRAFKLTQSIDKALFRIPGVRHLAWFGLIVATK